jgi:hypothetical protein
MTAKKARELDRFDRAILNCGTLIGFKEITWSLLDNKNGDITQLDDEDARAIILCKETTQITKLVRFTSRYLFILTTIYLIQAIYCLSAL